MSGPGPPDVSSVNSDNIVSQKPIVKVMYLFAGKRRQSDVGSILRSLEAKGQFTLHLEEIDIERGPEHDLRDEKLWESINAKLQQGDWFLIVSPPCNTFSRARHQYRKHPGPRPLRNRTWPKGFPWLSSHNKKIVQEANEFVQHCLEACRTSALNNGFFLLEHPEDLGQVEGEHPGSIWQWGELHDLISATGGTCFAIHQCQFGALFPKPTRLLTNAKVKDSRCHFGLPKFDRFSRYLGPLSRQRGHNHKHKLIGKMQESWNTAPSAAYPPQLCQFIVDLILVSCKHSPAGGGDKNPKGSKRKAATSLTISDTVSNAELTTTVSDSVAVVIPDSVEDITPTEKRCKTAEVPKEHFQTLDSESSFDMAACKNFGSPITVEWDGKTRPFIDGLGLCSPTRWPPDCRDTTEILTW